MKRSLTALIVAAMLLATSLLAPSVAAAADTFYFAVKADPGLGFTFYALAGKKKLFDHGKPLITTRGADGYYVLKAPAGFDPSKMTTWCVTEWLVKPDTGPCSPKGSQPVPADHIFRLAYTG